MIRYVVKTTLNQYYCTSSTGDWVRDRPYFSPNILDKNIVLFQDLNYARRIRDKYQKPIVCIIVEVDVPPVFHEIRQLE